MKSLLVGCWRVQDGIFAGLEYRFRADGSFEMELSEFQVRASGRYQVRDGALPAEIDIHFVQHTAPEGLGIVRGIFEVDGNTLRMRVGGLSDERWMNPNAYITYARS